MHVKRYAAAVAGPGGMYASGPVSGYAPVEK